MRQKFYQKVDLRSRKAMTEFLETHFRYFTGNSWNRSTSYAHNVKIDRLGLEKEVEDALYELRVCEGAYDTINDLLYAFEKQHDYRWQAWFNGRNGGYLVLYQGGAKRSEYKSYCKYCGQPNFTSVKETGKKCGRCERDGRVDYLFPPINPFVYYGDVD